MQIVKKQAFSLIELAVVVLLIGLVTIVALNGKSLLTKASCVASSFGTKTVTDNLDNPTSLTENKNKAYEECVNRVITNNSVNSTPLSVVTSITGLSLWLDASDQSTIITTASNAVDQWLDKSSNGNNASQSISSSKPTTNLNKINNLNTIYYDGVNDSLTISNLNLNSVFTIFVVLQSAKFFIEHSVNTNSNDGFYFYGYGGGPFYLRRSTTSITFPNNVNWIGSGPAIGYFRNDGTNAGYAKNSSNFIASVSSSSVPKTDAVKDLYIGSRAGSSIFSAGNFAEIIIYNKALTDQEVISIINYLGSKWNITIN